MMNNEDFRLFSHLNATLPPLLPLYWDDDVIETSFSVEGTRGQCDQCPHDIHESSLMNVKVILKREGSQLAIHVHEPIQLMCGKPRCHCSSMDILCQGIKDLLEKKSAKLSAKLSAELSANLHVLTTWRLYIKGEKYSPSQASRCLGQVAEISGCWCVIL